jgi:N-acyl-D-amino-acid deacylase
LDTIIHNVKIVDGSGAPAFVGDIGIEGEKIAAVGGKIAAPSALEIDGTGLVASPGFIDSHNHQDVTAIVWPQQRNLVTQGITTSVSGQCGFSAAPDSRTFYDYLTTRCTYGLTLFWNNLFPLQASWDSQREYAAVVNAKGVAVDIAPHVGHAMLRWRVGARGPEPLTPDQLTEMKHLLARALEDGAFGLSSALSYDPNKYATYDELLELTKVCAEYGRVYQIHTLLGGSAEGGHLAAKLAKEAKVKTSIAHYQSCMPSEWVRNGEMLLIINAAREEGTDISFNVIPDPKFCFTADSWKSYFLWIANLYAGKTWSVEEYDREIKKEPFRRALARLIEKHIDGPTDTMREYLHVLPTAKLVGSGNPESENRTIADLARERGVDGHDLAFDIICGVSEHVAEGHSPILDVIHVDPAYTDQAIIHEVGMPGTDITPNESAPETLASTPWPGGYTTMPFFFGRSRALGSSLEETVRHMTSLPASCLNLTDRGLLRPGLKADIVVFDEHQFAPRATYDDLCAPAAGVHWVFVSGVPTLARGAQTDNLPGRMLEAC